MTPYLLLVLFLAAAVVAIAASGPAGSTLPPRAASDPPVDWQARYEGEHARYLEELERSKRRLAGWRSALRQRNNGRARYRRLVQRRGTGIPWLDEALCIHSYESVNWHLDGHHDGGMQFDPGTWRRAGGYGYAYQAHPIEQLYRAYRIWAQDGGSWREWSTHRLCGV